MDGKDLKLSLGINRDEAGKEAKEAAKEVSKGLKTGLDENVKNAQKAADKEVDITKTKIEKQKDIEKAWTSEQAKLEKKRATEVSRIMARQAVDRLRDEANALKSYQNKVKKPQEVTDKLGNAKSVSFKSIAEPEAIEKMNQLLSEATDKLKEFKDIKESLGINSKMSNKSIDALASDTNSITNIETLTNDLINLRTAMEETNNTSQDKFIQSLNEQIQVEQKAVEESEKLEKANEKLEEVKTNINNGAKSTLKITTASQNDIQSVIDAAKQNTNNAVDETTLTQKLGKITQAVKDVALQARDAVIQSADAIEYKIYEVRQSATESADAVQDTFRSMDYGEVDIAGVLFDANDVMAEADNLKEAITDIIANSTGAESPQLRGLQSQLKTDYEQVERLQEELEEIGSRKIKTDAFVEMEQHLKVLENEANTLDIKYNEAMRNMEFASDKAAKQLAELEHKRDTAQLMSTFTTDDKTASNKYKADVQIYQKQIDDLQDAERRRAIEAGEDLKKINDKWELAQRNVAAYKSEVQKQVESGAAYYSGTETQEYADKLSQLDKQTDKLSVHVVKYKEMAGTVDRIKLSWGDVVGYIMRASGENLRNMGNNLKQIGGQIANIIVNMKKLGKATVQNNAIANMSFKKLLKMILRYGLGIRGTFMLIRKLRATLKEDFKVMATDIPEFGEKIEGLKASFETLKHAFGSAFEPIANIAIPLLTSLMDKLVSLFDLIGQISAAFFGQKQYVKAIKQTTAATKEATAAAKGYLSPIDTIHQYTKDKGKGDSSNGASGWYETAEISDEASAIAAKFKNFIAGIQEAIKPFTDALKKLWNEGLSKFVNFAWTGLKDFYEHFLVPIGKWAFGENTGLTRLVNVINTFLKGINWDELNRALRDFWDAIEPYAEAFGEGLIDFFRDALTFLKNNVINKLPALLDAITKVLKKGNPEMVRKWGYALGAIATGLVGFKVVKGIVTFFTPILSFLAGIVKFLLTPVLAIGAKLLTGVAGGFKTFFGVMKSGASGGVLDTTTALGKAISKYKDVLAGGNGKLSAFSAGVKTLRAEMSPLAKTLTVAAGGIVEFLTVSDGVKGLVTGTKSLAGGIAEITAGVVAAGAAFSLVFGFPVGLIATAIVGLAGLVVGFVNGLKELETQRALTSITQEAEGLSFTLDDLKDAFSTSVQSIVGNLTILDGKFDELSSKKTTFEELSNGITLVVDSMQYQTNVTEEELNTLSENITHLKETWQDYVSASFDFSIAQAQADMEYLRSQGELTNEMEQGYLKRIAQLTDEKNATIDNAGKIAESLGSLTQQYIDGSISLEDYQSKYHEFMGQAGDLGLTMSGSTSAIDETNQAIKDLAGQLDLSKENITSFDDINKRLQETLTDVGNTYKEASNSISQAEKETTDAMKNQTGVQLETSQAHLNILKEQNTELHGVAQETADILQKEVVEKGRKVMEDAIQDYRNMDENEKLLYNIAGVSEEAYAYARFHEFAENVISSEDGLVGQLNEQLGLAEDEIWVDDFVQGLADTIKESTSKDIFGRLDLNLSDTLSNVFNNELNDAKGKINAKEIGTEVGKDATYGYLEGQTSVPQNEFTKATDETEEKTETGFNTSFDRHSPAKKMYPIGEDIILGIFEGFKQVDFQAKMSEWWKENVNPWFTVDRWTELGKGMEVGLTNEWNAFVSFYKDNEIWEFIKGEFSEETWTVYGQTSTTALMTQWNMFTDTLRNDSIWQFIRDSFSLESWTFTSIKDGLVASFNAAWEAVKQGWNGFADWLEQRLTLTFDSSPTGQAMQKVMGAQTTKLINLPRLAQGGVIPPNRQFMAILGDQKSGTNIEAPLETIKQAVREVMGNNNGNGTVTVNLTLDRRILAQAVVAEGKVIKATSNQNIFNF